MGTIDSRGISFLKSAGIKFNVGITVLATAGDETRLFV